MPKGEQLANLAQQVLAGPQGQSFRVRAKREIEARSKAAEQLDIEDYIAGMPPRADAA